YLLVDPPGLRAPQEEAGPVADGQRRQRDPWDDVPPVLATVVEEQRCRRRPGIATLCSTIHALTAGSKAPVVIASTSSRIGASPVAAAPGSQWATRSLAVAVASAACALRHGLA